MGRRKETTMKTDLFEGELSESDSDSSVLPPATVVSYTSTGKKHGKKKDIATPRPQRRQIIKSYAESDTDEDNMVVQSSARSAVARGKRRRESSADSPSKRPKIAPEKTPRRRTFSTGQLPQNGRTLRFVNEPLSMPNPSHNSDLVSLLADIKEGKQVFIRLNAEGSPSLEAEDHYWWPGKVTNFVDSARAEFRLYGDDGHGSSREVIIPSPTNDGVQSVWKSGTDPRYDKHSFQKGTFIDTIKFQDAVLLLIHDNELDDADDILFTPEAPRIESPPLSDHSLDSDNADKKKILDWRAPSPSEFADYLQQRVFCKATHGSATFWPARVVDYIAPTKPSEKPRFLIHFFDWKTAKLTKDCFFTQYDADERKFASCELDRKKLLDWVQKNSYTQDDDEEPFEFDFSTLQTPNDTIPKPNFFINELALEEQFAYTIPFMQKVLLEEYPPSQSRIDPWMQGGSKRQGITSNPIQGGNLAELEWHVFGQLVNAWALPKGDESTGTLAPNRPRGSERYEALDSKDKSLFVFDVLIGEAVIQLLLLRDGQRTNIDIQNDEEEARLYKIGRDLSLVESTSILVRTILEARSSARARLRMKPETLIDGDAESESVMEKGARRTRQRNGK